MSYNDPTIWGWLNESIAVIELYKKVTSLVKVRAFKFLFCVSRKVFLGLPLSFLMPLTVIISSLIITASIDLLTYVHTVLKDSLSFYPLLKLSNCSRVKYFFLSFLVTPHIHLKILCKYFKLMRKIVFTLYKTFKV